MSTYYMPMKLVAPILLITAMALWGHAGFG